MRATAIIRSYKDVGTILRAYYRAYGGSRAVLLSPYFHTAFVLAAVTAGLWSRAGWWDIPISVLPNVIGFTLAGYAMLIAFGDERFKALLTAPSAEHPASAFMAINATFMHFLVVQIVALLVAIVAKSRPFSSFDEIFHVGPAFASYYTARAAIVYAGWFAGYVLFMYALTLAFAATAAVFRVARWFDMAGRIRLAEKSETGTDT